MRAVVLQPQADEQTVVNVVLPVDVSKAERQALRVLIIDELRQGVLVRYGLRFSQLLAWQVAYGV